MFVKVATVMVTVVFSYLALNAISFDVARRALADSDYWWLLPALLAFALGNVARALRWRALFTLSRRPPATATLNAMLLGYFYNSILPARAGEAARVLVLTRRSSSVPVEVTGTIVLERLYDLAVLLLAFFVALPWLPRVSWFGPAAIMGAALALAIVLAVIALAVFEDRPLRLLLRPLARFSPFSDARLERSLEELTHGLSGLRCPRVALEASLLTVAAWMFSVLCTYLMTLAFHLHLSFASGVLVVVAIGLSMVLPSPPAAVGVFEGATLLALEAYKIPASGALPYAVVLHLVNFVPFLFVGVLLLRYNARNPVATEVARSS